MLCKQDQHHSWRTTFRTRLTRAHCAAQTTPKLDGQGSQGLSPEALGTLGTVGTKMDLDGGAPVLTEQWRKRWMGAKGDEQIEIGPLIGRGGECLGLAPPWARNDIILPPP